MANANIRNEKSPKNVESVADSAEMKVTMNADPIDNIPTGGDIVQTAKNTLAINEIDYAADANRGMEGATAESFAIPFLVVLQKGSPQVDETSGKALPGARQGMLFNTVTGRMYDARETPVTIVPCAYKRTWIRWGSRKAGGGFKAELTEAQVNQMRKDGTLKEFENKLIVPDKDGNINDKCDIVNDTRNHYVLILDYETGAWEEAMLSLTSTQIKKSRQLMSIIGSVKKKHPVSDMIFTPPAWANKIATGTVPESNDKGNWMGITFIASGSVDRRDIYEAGKSFCESVQKGAVTENYNNLAENAPQADESAGGTPSASQPEKF